MNHILFDDARNYEQNNGSIHKSCRFKVFNVNNIEIF